MPYKKRIVYFSVNDDDTQLESTLEQIMLKNLKTS